MKRKVLYAVGFGTYFVVCIVAISLLMYMLFNLLYLIFVGHEGVFFLFGFLSILAFIVGAYLGIKESKL